MTNADKIAAVLRPIAPGGALIATDVPIINDLGALWDARAPGAQPDPRWIVAGRKKIGWGEIVGPKHNPWIAAGWARLGVKWFNDDETPWCGFFVADCLNDAGLGFPKNYPSAASFKAWGADCAAQVGAIGVKARVGGNHVFFIVGETADRLFYKALGGNQSNRVSIVDIRKTDVDAIRWPAGAALPAQLRLPAMARGTIAGSES